MTGREAFVGVANVSRETFERLEAYEALLTKWNTAINLVSPQTISQIWTRHFLDSAQIFNLVPEMAGHWLDLGSGGGFPGLVVAILAAEKRPDLKVTLVESDGRKAAFLTTAASTLGLKITVRAKRIESLAPENADVLSARALASLDVLLQFASRHLLDDGVCLFPKGARWRDEVAIAQNNWTFDLDHVESLTDPDAVVLRIRGINHV